MKIAAGIIGIIVGFIVMLQSCAVATTSSLAQVEIGKQEGLVGVMVAAIYLVAGAFAFGLPAVSCVLFTIGGVFAMMASSTFGDLAVWAWVGWVLAVLTGLTSYLARRKRAAAKPQ